METFNNQILDSEIEHAVDLLKLANSQSRETVLKLLLILESKLIGKIAASGLVQGTSINSQKVDKLLAITARLIDEYYGKISDKTDRLIAEIAGIEVQVLEHAVNDPTKLDLLKNLLTSKEVKSYASSMLIAGSPNSEWWMRQASSLQRKIADTVRENISNGGGVDELTALIKGTPESGYKNGVMRTARSEGDALIRTAITTASNDARMDLFMKNADIFSGFQQISVLDSRTSQICIAYSGKIWDLELNPVDHNLPFNGGTPRHWRCRSFIIPILKSWQDLGFNIDELPPSTRSSMDGQVAADTTYEKWLSTKSTAIQNSILGKGTADLWRAGKISFSDLVDSTGRHSLTLSELKAKISKRRS